MKKLNSIGLSSDPWLSPMDRSIFFVFSPTVIVACLLYRKFLMAFAGGRRWPGVARPDEWTHYSYV